MKSKYILFAGLFIACIGLAFTINFNSPKKAGTGKGFALIELYTSEGCSSCPSADKLLAKVAQEYKDKEVYVLAYHVDYWDRLGWKDAFSNPQYSQRQRLYASYLKLDGVYTPQAVVNGRTEFVGSDEGRMNSAITQSLSKSTAVNLMLTNIKVSGNKATLQYHITGSAQGADNLELAVIQNHAQTQVKAGENSGRILPHVNIVEKLQAVNFKSDVGNAEVNLPDGFNAKDWAIIGFVQSNRNGEILAVQKAVIDAKELAVIK